MGRLSCSAFIISLVVGGSARAANPVNGITPNAVLTLSASGCEVKPGTQANADPAFVKIVAPEDVTAVSSKKDDGTTAPVTALSSIKGTKHQFMIKLNRADVHSNLAAEIAITTTGTPVDCDSFQLFKPANGDQSGSNNPPSVDVAAMQWFEQQGEGAIAALRRSGKGLHLSHHTRFLVHLPSGQPAFPFPSALTEGTPIQVAILVPKSADRTVKLKVTSCADVNTFRTTLTEAPQQGKQAGEHNVIEAPTEFVLVPVGQTVTCGAGTFTYDLDPGADAATQGKQAGEAKAPAPDGATPPPTGADTSRVVTTNVRMRPKYHLAAIALLSWDSAQLANFEKVRQPMSTNNPMGNPIIGTFNSSVGLSAYVGAQWMIGGVDYERMRWWNYFANLWVAVNPVSPLQDVAVGLALTPTGGVSVAVGLSLHANARLNNGYKVGAIFAGDGDIPTSRSWSNPATGAVLGLAVDSRIYDAMMAKFTKK